MNAHNRLAQRHLLQSQTHSSMQQMQRPKHMQAQSRPQSTQPVPGQLHQHSGFPSSAVTNSGMLVGPGGQVFHNTGAPTHLSSDFTAQAHHHQNHSNMLGGGTRKPTPTGNGGSHSQISFPVGPSEGQPAQHQSSHMTDYQHHQQQSILQQYTQMPHQLSQSSANYQTSQQQLHDQGLVLSQQASHLISV